MKDKVKVKLHRGEIICTVEETDIPVKKESEKRKVKGE